MSYLLDTNILSETRKPRPDPGVLAWITAAPADGLYLSALTVGEIERGVSRLSERGDHRQANIIAGWLDEIVRDFSGRILPVTAQVARRWGGQRQSHPVATVDGLIAATAQVHDWTLITRNVKDFAPLEVRVLNPFSA